MVRPHAIVNNAWRIDYLDNIVWWYRPVGKKVWVRKEDPDSIFPGRHYKTYLLLSADPLPEAVEYTLTWRDVYKAESCVETPDIIEAFKDCSAVRPLPRQGLTNEELLSMLRGCSTTGLVDLSSPPKPPQKLDVNVIFGNDANINLNWDAAFAALDKWIAREKVCGWREAGGD